MSRLRSLPPGRRVPVGAAIVAAVAAAAAVTVAVDPFAGAAASSGNGIDNAAPTSLASIERRDLSQQTQVSATLGYADPATISVPGGTAPASVQQARQAAETAQSSLASARATLAADGASLAQAGSTLAADRRKLAVDCAGESAAQSGAASGNASGGSGGGSTPCASDSQALAADEQAVTADTTKVQADRRALSSAGTALAEANAALASTASTASAYGQGAAYTMLPVAGAVVTRGHALYAVDGQPVVLLYGTTAAWRAFAPGMSPGADVAELSANLRALGYGAPAGSAFTAETASAVEAFQSARGLPPTGELMLGSVVFDPGAVRVTSVTPTTGAAVQPGPVLSVTSTRRVVTIALDASQQTSVRVGDPVEITLPDNSTTPGHVSYVGTVATTPSSADQPGGSSSPTIEVDVRPDRPAATGRLDQAPVDVSITTATVRDVLVVPVTALVALAGGGYAVEEAEAGGVHRLVGVGVGLFDDAQGLVQVSGAGLAAGQRVVVPAE